MKKSFKYALAIGIIKKAVLLIFVFSNYSFGQTYNVTDKTIGSPNYGKSQTIEVEENYFSKLNREGREKSEQDSERRKNSLIEGAGKAYGSGLNINTPQTQNFNTYNAPNKIINVTAGSKSSNFYSVNGIERK